MGTSTFKYDVFLSHNRTDKDWTRTLARRLMQRKFVDAKFRVFLDEWTIEAGESIPTAVRRGLRQSQHIIIIMTPEWVASEWCQQEIDTTIMSDPSARRRRIIPILLRDCTIPEDIARLKYIDFRDPNSFDANFARLVSELRGSPVSRQLRKICEQQRQMVLNLPILPWTPEYSPSLDFIWPELFVEPHLQPHKHPEPPVRLNRWFANYNWDMNIAVVGPPGIGKSTALRAIFLKLSDPNSNLGCQRVPLLTSASEILEFEQSRHKSFMTYLSSRIGTEIPNSLVSKQGTLILVDGLDEVDESKVISVLNNLRKVTSGSTVLWTGCRSDFFFRNIATKADWNAFFYDILELLEWDEDTDSLIFASRYAERLRQPVIYTRLLSLKSDFPEITPFLRNPFELTLLLYLLSDKKQLERQNLINSYSLYRTFYENWIAREHHRGTSRLCTDIISRIHRAIASALFSSKGLGIDLARVTTEVESDIPFAGITTDTSLMGLLITRGVPGTSTVKVLRFWHETIGEFLLAEGIVAALHKGGDSLLQTLRVVYDYEVNRFVRGAFQCMSRQEREAVLRNMEELYVTLFSTIPQVRDHVVDTIRAGIRTISVQPECVDQSELVIRIREQILYYIGRLPMPSFPEILRFAYYNEPSSLLRRIAALGAILHGDERIETDYLEKLTLGSPEDKENRSVQLVYFGDVDGDIHSYCDDDKCAWERTRNAIYERLQLGSQREMRLRWWDLRTLYLFYTSRMWSDLVAQEQVGTVASSHLVSDEFSEKKVESLRQEKDRLVKQLSLIASSAKE